MGIEIDKAEAGHKGVIAEKASDRSVRLVLVDVGNSRAAVAGWSEGERSVTEHLALEGADVLIAAVARQWEGLEGSGRRAVVISSVNPAALAALRAACDERGIGPVMVVGRELEAPMEADLPEPQKVGSDRLCAAAGAFARIGAACVVADFGTALTIDLVADNGVFLGGTILPGMALSARALHEHTALLPLVEMGPTSETLGKDTASAIKNGVFAMLCGALREIAERYATELGRWLPLVVTGGDGAAVARVCDFVDHVVPDLCLEGLVLAYQQHVERVGR